MNNFSGERYETDQRENVLCECCVSSIPLYHPPRFLGSNQISYINVLIEVNEVETETEHAPVLPFPPPACVVK